MSYDALPGDDIRAAAAALAAFGATPLDWNWDATAAVWQTDEEQTGEWERALVASGMLEWDAPGRRYSLHQTVHAFLERRADPASYERHAAYYAALMRQHGWEVLRHFKSDIEVALATLDQEIGQIERGQAWAVQATPSPDHDDLLIDYAFGCATYFNLRRRYDEKIVWINAGQGAAERQGRERDVAAMLANRANVYQRIGRYDEAITAYNEAIGVNCKLNMELDLALNLNNLGSVYRKQGRYDYALEHYQRSLAITERLDNQARTASTLGNLGIVYGNQGSYEEAIEHYQRSLAIKERIGNQAGIASTLGNLGNLYRKQGRYEEAIEHYQRSLAIKERIGNVAGVARTCWNLGLLYKAQDMLTEALPLVERAAEIAERIGMPQAEQYRTGLEDLRARLAGQAG